MSSLPALVQETTNNSSTSTIVLTTTSSTTSGNTLIASIAIANGNSVTQITDSLGNRWIRAANGYSATGPTSDSIEIWYARGILAGSVTVTITTAETNGTSYVNLSEWSGLWYADPLDQWGTYYNSTSNGVAVSQSIQPRAGDTLFLGMLTVGSSGSVSSIPTGYSSLTINASSNNVSLAYLAQTSNSASQPTWDITSNDPYVTVLACFRSGVSGQNPLLQFPEVLVETCSQSDYLSPLKGLGIWTNISSYVTNMSIGPLGRQHELDRVQATNLSIGVNNRDGSFNTWNSDSFLYNAGDGLQPMNPFRIQAAWNGTTYPVGYAYLQSITPAISDVLNVDATIECTDILQLLALKYLSTSLYETTVEDTSSLTLEAYYRCNDPNGSFSVNDLSSNNYLGWIVGTPAFGAYYGPRLYSVNTVMDTTDGNGKTNVGYFQTSTNYNTQPPTTYNPLSSATNWTLEFWFQWSTRATQPTAGYVAHGPVLASLTMPNQANDQWLVQVGSDTTGASTMNEIYLVTNGASETGNYTNKNLLDGEWHHCVITYEGSPTNSLLVYVDGVQNTFGSSQSNLSGPIDITIGGGANQNVNFPGNISDVALYSGVMSATDVATHYNTALYLQTIIIGAGNGDYSAGRLNQILDIVGLDPTIMLNVPYAFRTFCYAETNSVATTSALNYLQTQSETEPGLIYQGPDGILQAQSRQYQYLNPTSTTAQITLGDSSFFTNHFEGTTFELTRDDLDVWNQIQVQSARAVVPSTNTTAGVIQEWGPEQSSNANKSANLYGPRTLQGLTSLQQEYDFDALALAQNYGVWYNFPLNRVESLTIQSQTDEGANISYMLKLGLTDRMSVLYTGQTPGPIFTQDSIIEQLTHSVSIVNGPTWSTTYALSPFEISMDATILGTYKFGSGSGVLTL